jgi:hypothetical protein
MTPICEGQNILIDIRKQYKSMQKCGKIYHSNLQSNTMKVLLVLAIVVAVASAAATVPVSNITFMYG